MTPTFRFAPTPNGQLHLGHALSAWLNHDAARASGGRLLLRLEDADAARCRNEHADAMLADLAWLGLTWEEPVRRQSREGARYALALDGLVARGLAYPCFCSRGEVLAAAGSGAPRDATGAVLYPGTCRRLEPREAAARAAREPHALRLDAARALAAIGGGPLSWDEAPAPLGDPRPVPADPLALGDAVLRPRDGVAAYHLAVVLDDADQGVSRVVRGADVRPLTPFHRLLQEGLGLPAPVYHHHALVLGPDGRKLAKSREGKPLAAWRAAGATPADLRRRLGLAEP